jgi:phosphoribosylformylglycinamidine synthase
VGKFILLRLTESDRAKATARVEEMCRRLLANPVIEDFRFDLEETP